MLKERSSRTVCLLLLLFAILAAWGVVVEVAHAKYHKVDPLDHVVFSRYQNSGVMLTGKLLTGGGTPSVGTTVSAASYKFAGGPPSYYHGIVSARGHYRIWVPPGPSRIIVVAAPGEAAKVKEIVSPGLWITIRSRSRGRMLFTGGIMTDRASVLPTLLIQDRTPGGWETFGAVNPNYHSHLWRFRYRAPRAVRGFRFRFRVASLPNAAWSAGRSAPSESWVMR